MLDQQKFSDLIGMIYDAASAPHLWLRFVEETSNLLGAHMSNLILLDARQPSTAVVESYGLDQASKNILSNRAHEDYWIEGGKRLPSGTVILGSEIISLDDMHQTAYYREFADPNNAEYMLGAVVENRPERQALISFIRGKQEGDFDSESKQGLALLMPHIQRAHYIYLQLANKSCIEQVLDDSPYGVILLDNTNSPVFVNQKAKAILVEKDGISIRYGAIKLYEYTDQLELENHLKNVRTYNIQYEAGTSGTLTILRPSGKLPYHVTISPMSKHPTNKNVTGSATTLLSIHDPTEVPSLSRNMLRTAYGLTEAETTLCECLFEGSSLDEAAQELYVSRNTAKTHLRHVFEKCGVNSQAALMRLLALGLKG